MAQSCIFSLETQNTKTHSMLKNKVLSLTEDGSQVNRHLLALQAVVVSQQLLVLLMGAELDSSIRDDSNHGGRVSPPQTEKAILQVSPVDQFVGLLRSNARTHTHTNE